MIALSKPRSRPLTFRDAMHSKTAKCWLCLGDFSNPDQEIRKIRHSACTHPDVVKVRYTFLRTLYGW